MAVKRTPKRRTRYQIIQCAFCREVAGVSSNAKSALEMAKIHMERFCEKHPIRKILDQVELAIERARWSVRCNGGSKIAQERVAKAVRRAFK